MTSTSGVMLISLIMPSSSSPAKGLIAIGVPRRSVACASRDAGRRRAWSTTGCVPVTKNACRPCAKRFSLVDDRLVRARQCVVAEHRRNRDEQAERGHDQRFADRAGDLVDRRLAASRRWSAARDRCPTPCRTGRRTAPCCRSTRESRDPLCMRRDAFVHRVLQAARDPVRHVHAVVQMRLRLMMVIGGFLAREGEREERIVLRRRRAAPSFLTPSAKSSECQNACSAFFVRRFRRITFQPFTTITRPRQHRHDQQRERDAARHEIPLRPDVRQSVVLHCSSCFFENLPQSFRLKSKGWVVGGANRLAVFQIRFAGARAHGVERGVVETRLKPLLFFNSMFSSLPVSPTTNFTHAVPVSPRRFESAG